MTATRIILEVLDDAALMRRDAAQSAEAAGDMGRAALFSEEAATLEEIAAGIRDGRVQITVMP